MREKGRRLDVAPRVGHRVTMMHDGCVIVEGTPDGIRANEQTIVEGLVQTVKDLVDGGMRLLVVEPNLGVGPLPEAA
jgi:hypothetical protein